MFNFCFYDSDSKLFDLDTLFDFPVDFPRSDLVASVARALGKDPEERVIETLFSQFGADCYNISSGKVSDSAIRTKRSTL